MANRFQTALLIQEGACNPSGIAHALVDACREAIAENASQRDCPAVRLIAHQLAYILRVSEIDDSLDCYGKLTEACREKAGA